MQQMKIPACLLNFQNTKGQTSMKREAAMLITL